MLAESVLNHDRMFGNQRDMSRVTSHQPFGLNSTCRREQHASPTCAHTTIGSQDRYARLPLHDMPCCNLPLYSVLRHNKLT